MTPAERLSTLSRELGAKPEVLVMAYNLGVEQSAQVVLTKHVIHGDHHAAYSAPSNDASDLAGAVRALKIE